MKKRLISLFLSFVLIFSLFSLSVSAEELPDSSHTHTWVDSMYPSFDGEVGGFHVTVELKECKNCKAFLHNVNINGMVFKFVNARACLSLSGELQDFVLSKIFLIYGKNATATKFEAGGGQPGTGGAGRYPSGYTSDGVANYNKDGVLTWQPSWPDNIADLLKYRDDASAYVLSIKNYGFYLHLSMYPLDGKEYVSSEAKLWQFTFTAPISGFYYSVSLKDQYSYLMYGELHNTTDKYSIKRTHYQKGSSMPLANGYFYLFNHSSNPGSINGNFFTPIYCIIPDESIVTKQTNITINNNTWNGNIYQDTENNLTYIYPQYTTINDAGDTITNISENPIIYNSTTNQYYTYDSTTNNYYYITYVTATPEPSASPEPTATPDPGTGDNTPTPTPGGSSGGNSGSTSGDKDNSSGSGWNPFKWLTDLLKDIVESILKGLWKLLTSIFGFILWLLSLLFKLFPWLPNSGILALCAGVVVVTVIRIIKFITGR